MNEREKIFKCQFNARGNVVIVGIRDFGRYPSNNEPTEILFPKYIDANDIFHLIPSKFGSKNKTVYKVDEVDITRQRTASLNCKKVRKISFADGIKITCFDFLNTLPLLEEVNLPTDIKSIPSDMFCNCLALSKVNFEDLTQLKFIGKNAFKNCKSLSSVTFNSSVKNIGSHAFENTGLTSVIIPKGIYEVSSWSFSKCKKLTSVEVYSNLISSYAFYRSTNLANFVFDNSWLSHIGKGAFVHTKIKNVNLTCSAVMTPCKDDILSAFNEDATISLPYFID